MIHVGVLSVVPSPYQRNLFAVLAAHPEIKLEVFYQSLESIDNPWPEAELNSFEFPLNGRRISYGAKRAYVNWSLPDFRRFDFVILNTSYLSTAAQWVMRSRLEDTPWVFWGERMRTQQFSLKQFAQEKLSAPLARADAIACIGSLAVDSYREMFPGQTLFNIPYYCTLNDYAEAAESRSTIRENDPVRILFCGQMIRRKGVDLLIRAFDRLVADGKSVRLILVGREADLPEFLKETSPHARQRTSFLGFQNPDDLPNIFAQADVFVLPSRHDGWGVVVNEALGSGLPIVCSDAVGAAHDIIVPGENGAMVPAGEVDALYEGLLRLVTDAGLRMRWSEASARLRRNWTPEVGANKWVETAQVVVEKFSRSTV